MDFTKNEKLLIMQALNRTNTLFSNHANESRSLSNGTMRILFDSVNKSVVFQYGNNMERYRHLINNVFFH